MLEHALAERAQALAPCAVDLGRAGWAEQLGLEPDVRRYDAVRPILYGLGIKSITLLTGNPEKRDLIIDAGVIVERTEPLEVAPYSWTRASMRAKQANGHTVVGQYVDDPTGAYP